mgnify:CR=1 FL=1
MEKKTGRSRKAVQSLKPKKLVYWAVAIPAFLALLLFAIVFLDHSDNDISRAMASKAMALSFADRDDIVASQGEHGSHFGTPDQDEWYAKYIDYMIEEGYLVKRRNKNRSLRSPRREERSREPGKEIPILGTVAAGTPITAVENIIGYIHYEPEKQHDNPLFALKVRGESMINAGICDGDLIIVEQTAYAENGDIVVALLDQEEATVKRFYKENGHFRLQPENDAMDPIYTEDLDLMGVVVALLRIYS